MHVLSGLHHIIGVALLGGLLSSCPAFGQQTNSSSADSTARRGAFTAALIYGNNSSFFGRTQATRFPYAAGELTYKSKFGVWGSATSYNLFSTTSFVDETDLSVGWDGDVSKSVDASVSYSHFLFAPNSPLVKSSVNNSIDTYVGLDWGYVYTRLNGSYLFGTSRDAFLILDNSRYFGFDHVFTPKGYLAIEPRVSVMAGTQRFAETNIEQQQQRGNNGNNGKGKSKNGKGNGNGNPGGGNGGNPGPVTVTTSTTITRFRILNYELRVPVTYSYGAVSWQVAWRYAVPVNLLPEDVSGARSYITTTLSLNL